MSTNQIQIETDPLETSSLRASRRRKTRRKGDISIFDAKIIRRAIPESFKKLDPRLQLKNPVMFVVEVGTTVSSWYFEFYPLGSAPS